VVQLHFMKIDCRLNVGLCNQPYMEQNLSWEADRHPGGQENRRLLRNSKFITVLIRARHYV